MRVSGERAPSLLALLNVVLRHRVLIVGFSLALGALWTVLTMLAPRTYTSVALFTPQARRAPSNLAGVAAQLGINVGTSDGSDTPQFYVDLVRTRPLLRKVVQARYRYRSEDGAPLVGDLTALYKMTDRTPALRIERGIRRLERDVGASSNLKTGVITVRVLASQPEVAQQIAANVLTGVNEFNLQRRQGQAGAERNFIEDRLGGIRVELRNAEDRLAQFLEANRNDRAPKLMLERERLDRQIAMQQELYTALAQAYGQAKIEEVRDTPVLATIQAPEVPVAPDPRGTIMKALTGLLLGGVLGLVLAFTRDQLLRSREHSEDEFREFSTLRRETLDDAIHPWRPLTRAMGRGRSSGSP